MGRGADRSGDRVPARQEPERRLTLTIGPGCPGPAGRVACDDVQAGSRIRGTGHPAADRARAAESDHLHRQRPPLHRRARMTTAARRAKDECGKDCSAANSRGAPGSKRGQVLPAACLRGVEQQRPYRPRERHALAHVAPGRLVHDTIGEWEPGRPAKTSTQRERATACGGKDPGGLAAGCLGDRVRRCEPTTSGSLDRVIGTRSWRRTLVAARPDKACRPNRGRPRLLDGDAPAHARRPTPRRRHRQRVVRHVRTHPSRVCGDVRRQHPRRVRRHRPDAADRDRRHGRCGRAGI